MYALDPIEDVELNLIESFEDVQRFFSWLGKRRSFLGWDTETTGLNPFEQGAKLRLFQFGDLNSGWVFRADRWLGVLEQVMREYTGKMVGQNVPFDIRWTEHHSDGITVPWGKQYDTRIMAHILDPTKSTALKALSARFLSPEAKRLQNSLAGAMKKQGWTWATIPYDFDIYYSYAALDPVLTARIAETFWPEVEANYFDVFALESETARICSNMELKGTMIDLDYCNSKREELLEFTATADKWCVKNYGLHPGQNQEVAITLIKEGVDLSLTTATGDWAMDKDVLEGIDHPLAKTVLAHRKATKISSTYFKNFLKMNNNGVLHPSINTLGARTGRMTIQNPAAQTLPRGRVVRDAFIPRPGNVWLSVDYDQIEMRLLAHFADEQAMIAAINSGDLHTETARLVYNDPTIGKGDPRRSLAKNAGFSKIYGAGLEKFALTAGVSLEDAQVFLDSYDTRFPGVKRFMKQVERVAKERLSSEGVAYVRSPLGRKHTADPDKIYTLTNFLVQGTAAEAFKQSLIDLDHAGFGDYLLLPVHDEINAEIPFEHAADLEFEFQQIMTQNNWKVPLMVSSSMAESWGAAK